MDTALDQDMPEVDDDFHNPEFIEVRLGDPQTEGNGFFSKYTTYLVSTKVFPSLPLSLSLSLSQTQRGSLTSLVFFFFFFASCVTWCRRR